MPYINKNDRTKFNKLLTELEKIHIDSAGELNYLITMLVHDFVNANVVCYQSYNDAIGALEGAKLELYRRQIAGYEDKKITENGDVP